MTEIVPTNVHASRPPECLPTGTPTVCANFYVSWRVQVWLIISIWLFHGTIKGILKILETSQTAPCKPQWHQIVVINSTELYKMVQNGAEWYPIVPNGNQWYLIVLNGTNWYPMLPNTTRCYPMVPNGSQLYPANKNGTKWEPMVPNSTKCYPMVPNDTQFYWNGVEWCWLMPNGAKWCKIVRNGA